MFFNRGVDYGKLDSWFILVFLVEIMGKRELYVEVLFILFFRIGFFRWSEVVGDLLIMKCVSLIFRD